MLKRETFAIADIYVPVKRRATLEQERVDAIAASMLDEGQKTPIMVRSHDTKPDQRVDQFMRLREAIEDQASRKFFEEQVRVDRPLILRSNDFSIVALPRSHPS